MPQLLKPTRVEKHFTTQTTQGEITVNINLVLTLQTDQDGTVTVSAEPKKAERVLDYVIPEIEQVSDDDLIDFGKNTNW